MTPPTVAERGAGERVSGGAGLGAGLRLLLTRRWLLALAAALLFAVAAWYLGGWQWGRYEAKAARADRIEAHYAAPAVPLTSVLTDSPLPLADEWTRVSATGQYVADEQVLVRNRPWDGTYGYEVLIPFTLDDGGTVLVDRGWVANSPEGADVTPEVPAVPAGSIDLTGWLRQGEVSLHRDMPQGQLASINIGEAERAAGTSLLGGYLVLEGESNQDGATPARPQALEEPDTGTGPHMAYAIQWWGTMPAGFVLVLLGLRRELQEGQTSGRPARERKVRIWDEEDD
ncbi:SURF1 family cytochrome oxidase biogenesis protein [Janibacter sp. G1551]|uniref:SURF1 family cytochrome oxidase biogenesis protein n=1 Tax=Janibacter sp. G1551 TaxID=3420440 RepID=UPI003D095398